MVRGAARWGDVPASAAVAAKAVACAAYREVGTSDHGPVVATFEI
jgi:exonuclease III